MKVAPNIASYVRPNFKAGGWDVIHEGHRRASAHGDTEAEARDLARQLLRQQGGGEVRVMNRYGKLVETDTVERSPQAA